MNIKSFIDHEVLNLLTLLQMIVLSEPVSEKARKQVSDLIKLSSLLIAHPDFFETGKRECFLEEVEMGEVIEIVLLMKEKSLEKRKISAQNLSETILVKTDKTLLKELLEALVEKMTPFISSLRFRFLKGERKLLMTYKGDFGLIERIEPLEALKKSFDPQEIIFQITLKFAEACGIRIEEGKGEIGILFPGSLS